jgi:hypothetical protein
MTNSFSDTKELPMCSSKTTSPHQFWLALLLPIMEVSVVPTCNASKQSKMLKNTPNNSKIARVVIEGKLAPRPQVSNITLMA